MRIGSPSTALTAGSAISIRAAPISPAASATAIDSPTNWTNSILRVAPMTLRIATSRARIPARAVARLT